MGHSKYYKRARDRMMRIVVGCVLLFVLNGCVTWRGTESIDDISHTPRRLVYQSNEMPYKVPNGYGVKVLRATKRYDGKIIE